MLPRRARRALHHDVPAAVLRRVRRARGGLVPVQRAVLPVQVLRVLALGGRRVPGRRRARPPRRQDRGHQVGPGPGAERGKAGEGGHEAVPGHRAGRRVPGRAGRLLAGGRHGGHGGVPRRGAQLLRERGGERAREVPDTAVVRPRRALGDGHRG